MNKSDTDNFSDYVSAAEELGLEDGIPLSPEHCEYRSHFSASDDLDTDSLESIADLYYAQNEYEDGSVESAQIIEPDVEDDTDWNAIHQEFTDKEVRYQIEQAELRRVKKSEEDRIEKIARRLDAGIIGAIRPKFHGRDVVNTKTGEKYRQSPQSWIENGMAPDSRSEYPLNAVLVDMKTGGIRLHALKVMHLIFASAYHAEDYHVSISKKALKAYNNTAIKTLKQVIQEDLVDRIVTIAATSLKNGSKPQHVTILADFDESRTHLNFKLSADVYEHLLMTGEGGNFYAWTDLLNVSRMKNVPALGLLPFFNLKSRHYTDAFTIPKSSLNVLMQTGHKACSSHTRQFFNRALKGLRECDYFRLEADINGRSRKTEDVQIALSPSPSYFLYRRVQKEKKKAADFQNSQSKYHVPARQIHNIVIARGEDTNNRNNIKTVHKELMVFMMKAKIESAKDFHDLVPAFARNAVSDRSQIVCSDNDYQMAIKFFDKLKNGRKTEVIRKLDAKEQVPQAGDSQDADLDAVMTGLLAGFEETEVDSISYIKGL